MAAFKDELDHKAVRSIALRVGAVAPSFDCEAFVAATCPGLDSRELKGRVSWIAQQLQHALHPDFERSSETLIAALGPAGAPSGDDLWGPKVDGDLRGFLAWPIAHFIGAYGVGSWDTSMRALEEVTKRFSGEFAIRHFLLREQDRTLARMLAWTGSDDQHIRRLASEGCRPRLPWGIQLKSFVADPSPVLPVLEALRHDPEEYVRRSVANNLNDIAKDHPDVVLDTLERWCAQGVAPRLTSHALRTLVKQGNPRALRLLGFAVPAQLTVESFEVTAAVELGGVLRIATRLRSTAQAPQRLAVDYVLGLVGAKNKPRQKVFKGSVRTLAPGESTTIHWKHHLKHVTTRRYYDGRQAVELVINGQPLAKSGFELSGC
jgi:3-methyladenine DNA glycosylase AlkC